MERRADIGVWGLGVMGRNLALNFAEHGSIVTAWDPWPEARAGAAALLGDVLAATPEDFLARLAAPRQILLMVKAGAPVDEAVAALMPRLAPGDVLIDGGNSHYRDTARRAATLAERGIDFIGMGVSGGEAGARHGPALMVGGARAACDRLAPRLAAIAAAAQGDKCCAWFGEGGAGHFVKMVHNGIEYAEMQLIAEAYLLLQRVAGLDYPAMEAVFRRWSAGESGSYLLEITAAILGRRDDETGLPLAELVLDKAGQKGTGQWTVAAALEFGVPAPTLAAALFARGLSALVEERRAASPLLAGPALGAAAGGREGFVAALGEALHAGKICAFAQGFVLLARAAAQHGWALDLARVAEVWRAGCIIRGRLLAPIAAACRADPAPSNLLLAPHFRAALADRQQPWRQVVAAAVAEGVPIPALSSALAYYDAYRSPRLWANLIQCQRDFFGAHGYERIDREGSFHTWWDAP